MEYSVVKTGKAVKNLFACILLASFAIKPLDCAMPLASLASQLDLLGREVEKGSEELKKLQERVGAIFKQWGLPVDKSYSDWKDDNDVMKNMEKIINEKDREFNKRLEEHFKRLHSINGVQTLKFELEDNLSQLEAGLRYFVVKSFEPLLILARSLTKKYDFAEEASAFSKEIESAIGALKTRIKNCFQKSMSLPLPKALTSELDLLESDPLSIFEDSKLQKLIETIWSSYYKAVDNKLGEIMLIP